MIEGGEFQGTAASRLELYEDALRLWPEALLFGHGAGSWPILNDIPDRLSTPHNMFLEVVVETGVVGLVLVTALLVVALRPVSIDRLRNDPLALCAFMLFVWALHQSQSGPRYRGESDHVHAARRAHHVHGAKGYARPGSGPAEPRPVAGKGASESRGIVVVRRQVEVASSRPESARALRSSSTPPSRTGCGALVVRSAAAIASAAKSRKRPLGYKSSSSQIAEGSRVCQTVSVPPVRAGHPGGKRLGPIREVEPGVEAGTMKPRAVALIISTNP